MKNQICCSIFSIQVELLDDEEFFSKPGSEVDEKRGERGGEGGGGSEVEGVVRVRSGVSEASEGCSRVRGLSESEERRGVGDGEAAGGGGGGVGGAQPFVLAVSVAPEGKGGPKRFACLMLASSYHQINCKILCKTLQPFPCLIQTIEI